MVDLEDFLKRQRVGGLSANSKELIYRRWLQGAQVFEGHDLRSLGHEPCPVAVMSTIVMGTRAWVAFGFRQGRFCTIWCVCAGLGSSEWFREGISKARELHK